MKLSIKEIKESGKATPVKYVRIGKKDFRFAQPASLTQHSDLVEKHETPISAGFFIYFDGEIHLQETPSTSLRLGPKAEDQDLLKGIFN